MVRSRSFRFGDVMDNRYLLLSEAKASSGDAPGELEGYGNVSGILDRAEEIVEAGAYGDLVGFEVHGFGGVGHDWMLPIGTIEEAREDSKGLWVRIKFHTTTRAQEVRTVVRERLERGKTVGLSIGYRVLEDAIETRDGKQVRILKKIELFEVSVVTVPANPESLVAAAKSRSVAGRGVAENAAALVADAEQFVSYLKFRVSERKAENRNLSANERKAVEAARDALRGAVDALNELIASEPAKEADVRNAIGSLMATVVETRQAIMEAIE